jgi:ribose transport system ATP-binding protein
MTFPGTRALSGVNLDVAAGEVHGLVGHNGSGKSTLVKILSGQHRPDEGSRVDIGGVRLPWESSSDSERLGLRVVHQDLGLVDSMSITENINLGSGYDAARLGRVAWRRENARAAEEMAALGYHHLDPKQRVADLPPATRSAVAIARALLPRKGRPEARVLLLDEVTATMPESEIDRLLELVTTLKSRGVAVLYVSHHLEEVLRVCDTVSVLKDGELVVTTAAANLTMESLADQVVGSSEWRESLTPSQVSTNLGADESASCRLVVEDLHGGLVRGVTFVAEPGRIVGIAGITGSGREDLAELLFGATPRSGSITLGGRELPNGNPRKSILMGSALLPADRFRKAIVPTQGVRENLTLSQVARMSPLRFLAAFQERAAVRDWISRLAIRGASAEGSVNTLSGGNQQKVLLARCLNVKPRLIILDEPTQGVDVGVVAEIHALIRELARVSTVVVCSSDSLELASLCSDVLVLQRGRIVGHLVGDDVTESKLDHLQLSQSRLDGITA